ncbi:hypothetical protein RFI_01670, partial [Reticulomyxa filosa]
WYPTNAQLALKEMIYQKVINFKIKLFDLHQLKIIQDTVYVKVTRNNELQKLFHEVVKNDYLHITFVHHKWPYLDWYLQEAIQIIHLHERREESEMELYYFKHKREILFVRPYINHALDKKNT